MEFKVPNYWKTTNNIKISNRTQNKKVRDPVKYLVEKGVPKRKAQEFLAQPAYINTRWKEDISGPYVNIDDLDIIVYGWKNEKKDFIDTIKDTENLRDVSRKYMKKEYGKVLSPEEIDKRILQLPLKYQKRLRRIQRIMKVIKK